MSRVIKFRAWWGNQKVMQYHASNGLMGGVLEHSSEWTWMQFTGLHDKHGREIYEGDIITSTHPVITPGYKWLVQWKDAGFEPFVSEERDHGELAFGVKEHLETFEVIGNIYENPELLTLEGGQEV